MTNAVPEKKANKLAEHPKYSEMISAAVGAMKERNGSSRQAIQKYVTANYTVGENVNTHLKSALKRMAGNGVLIQTKGKGASGSFKLSAVVVEKPKKPAKKPIVKKPIVKKAIKVILVIKKPKMPAAAAKKDKKPKTSKPAKMPTAKSKKTTKPEKTAAKKTGKVPKKVATEPKKPVVKTTTKTPAKKAAKSPKKAPKSLKK